ncbi:tetratricopeptide repeat protein [Kiloniella sp. b19]|uniref:tetratricopeptide repeat protein n=1 Tax=Kiloniella sp. GXU_MW_B19 TaxID=3141326 RepID=UPI0031D7BA4C
MRRFNRQSLFGVSLLGLVAFAPAVEAQLYSDGMKAFEAGNGGEAIEIWNVLAEEGDAQAQYSLAKLYETGLGQIEPDLKRAEQWYLAASKSGLVAADNNLAVLYADSDSVLYNWDKALEHWKYASQEGHSVAQYNYGLALLRESQPLEGDGKKDLEDEAFLWFDKASESGMNDARYAMARYYDDKLPEGSEARHNLRLLLQQAADEGHIASLELLGQLPELAPLEQKPAGSSAEEESAAETSSEEEQESNSVQLTENWPADIPFPKRRPDPDAPGVPKKRP